MEAANSVLGQTSAYFHNGRSVQSGGGTVQFRRNYLLGRWAAKQLRLDDANADLYGLEVARFGEAAAGEDAVVDLVRADIAACDGDTCHAIIRRRLRQFTRQAAAEAGSVAYGEAA